MEILEGKDELMKLLENEREERECRRHKIRGNGPTRLKEVKLSEMIEEVVVSQVTADQLHGVSWRVFQLERELVGSSKVSLRC